MRRLEAWLEGRHIGAFERDDDLHVSFMYDDDAPAVPISLSLPREKPHNRRAAERFLENLLPDHKAARRRMADAFGLTSADTFDLLEKAGEDVAGGLVLLPDGQMLDAQRADFITAPDRDIARRIESIKRDADEWIPSDVPARFSLAGTQGKFALAQVEGDWYWSNAGVPSTHILKPARPELDSLEEFEADTLQLARESGIPSPHADVLNIDGHTAFIVERFDRVPSAQGIARRLHSEDLAQARGVDPDKKYDVTAWQIVETLNEVDSEHQLSLDFVRQLTFNTLVSNADAHTKNYSILLRPDHMELAPLYDSLPVAMYPGYDQKLAMQISGAKFPQEVTPHHWRKLAKKARLDEDQVMDVVNDVARQVAERNADSWKRVPKNKRDVVREIIDRNVAATLGEPKTSSSGFSPGGGSSDTRRARTTSASNSGSFAPKTNSRPENSLQ